jgi:hypothetical protein
MAGQVVAEINQFLYLAMNKTMAVTQLCYQLKVRRGHGYFYSIKYSICLSKICEVIGLE